MLPGLLMVLLVASVVFVLLVADVGVAEAKKTPETLADQRPTRVGVVETDSPIDYVAVTWHTLDSELDTSHDEDGNAESHGAVRFRRDGAWGQWIPSHEDGAQAPDQWSSSFVAGGDAEAYQIRGIPARAAAPKAMAINTTEGLLVSVTSRPQGAADALSNYVSRAEWGANEDTRFVDGVESWPTTFFSVQSVVVPHTVTANDDPHQAATVRATYVHHAVVSMLRRLAVNRWLSTWSSSHGGGTTPSDPA